MSRLRTRVESLTQTLSFHLPTPWDAVGLHWRSDRCSGRVAAYRWRPALPDPPPGGRAQAVISVAGRRIDEMDGEAGFVWDGRDADGRLVVSPQAAVLTVAILDGDGAEADRFERRVALGRPDARALGTGGWTPGDMHVLHRGGRAVFTGDGRVRTRVRIGRTGDDEYAVDTWAGRRHVFDADGRHLRTTDLRSRAVLARFEYDDQGRLIQVTRDADPYLRLERPTEEELRWVGSGAVVEMRIGPDGTAREIGGPVPLTADVASDGLVTALSDGTGVTRRFAYDDGRLVRVDDPTGASFTLTRTVVDGGHRVLRLTDGGRESRVETRRSATGRVRRRECCGARQATELQVDASSRVLVRPDGLRIETTTEDGGVARRIRFPSGLELTTGIWRQPDGGRRQSLGDRAWSRTPSDEFTGYRLTSPAGRVLDVHVDGQGRPTRIGEDPVIRELTYDEEGRLASFVSPAGTLTVLRDDDGRPVGVERDDGLTTSFGYDAAGRLVEQRLPGGRTVRLDFDAVGNVLAVSPPGRPATRFLRSAAGRLERIEFPSVGGEVAAVTLEHDADGLVSAWTRADGERVRLERGPGGRPAVLTAAQLRIDFGYDPDTGALTRAATADGVVSQMAWDGPLLVSAALEGPASLSVRLEHGDDLLVARRTLGARPATEFSYDADGLMTRAGPMTIERDPTSGAPIAKRVGQVLEQFGYDELGRLREVTVTTAKGEVLRRTYDLDRRGRIRSLVERDGGTERRMAFAYDTADRLAEISEDGVTIRRFGYDDNGNRVRDERPDGSWMGTVDDRDRQLGLGPWTAEYGPDGELQRRWTADLELVVTHDARGLPTGIRTRDAEQRFLRDGLGRVVALGPPGRPRTVLLHDGLRRPVGAFDPAREELTEFVATMTAGSPDLLLVGDRVLRLVGDHVGSPRLVIDAESGEVVQRMRFDALGTLVEDTAPGLHPFGFAGGLHDPVSGMALFGVRAYDPVLMRWTSPDPLLFRGGMTNLYGYAHHDPVNHRDPTGTEVELCRQATNLGFGAVGDAAGLEHWWLRTDSTEAGMAPHPGDSTGNYTAIVDHEGRGDQPGSTCDPVDNVDEECVNAELAFNKFKGGVSYGQDTGFWDPITNTCQDVATDILNKCANPGTEPVVRTDDDDFVKWYSPDIDTAPPDYTPAQEYPSQEAAIESESDPGALWH